MARPRKFTTEELIEIIHSYIKDNEYITSIKYSELKKYSYSLGYKNITYQDFSRNEKISKFVEEYNNRRKMLLYKASNSDKIEKLSFSVDEIVEKNIKNKKQLILILKVIKEGYDRAFEKLKENIQTIKELKLEIDKQEDNIEKLRNKNKELKEEINNLKENQKENKEKEKAKWMYLAVKDMLENSTIKIDSEDQILDILNNFGKIDNDIINKDEIMENESITKVNINNFIEVQKIKGKRETVEKTKNELKLPKLSFLE